MTVQNPSVPRRSFLSRLGVGLAAFGAALVPAPVSAAQSPAAAPPPPWQPTRHTQDDWLDQVPGQHRLVFDTTMPEGLGNALLYANNFYLANQNGYGLGNADVAIVIVMRHASTLFAYNDAMWAKYGTVLAQRSNLIDPKTSQAPKVNIQGSTVDGLTKKGMHVAVCQMATRRFAGAIAQATGGNADAVYTELVGNLVGNAHMVSAGIVAVNRAQERGYAFASVGV